MMERMLFVVTLLLTFTLLADATKDDPRGRALAVFGEVAAAMLALFLLLIYGLGGAK